MRAFASHQRNQAAEARLAAARLREEAAVVRDRAAHLRDEAAQKRDEAARKLEEFTAARLADAQDHRHGQWLGEFARAATATELARQAAMHDREASLLDRQAAEKDRDAAQRERDAAHSDRVAAERDRKAADEEQEAAELFQSTVEADLEGKDAPTLLDVQRRIRSDRLSTLGRISAGVAHELNTPLAALQSNLAVLEARRAAPDGDVIGDLRASIERIARVIDDLRGWVRVDDSDATREKVDLRKVLEEAVATSVGQRRGDIVASVEVQPMLPLWGVTKRLREVFLNLLSRAADAMPEGRDGNEIHVRAFTEGRLVKIEVRDNGRTIDPDSLPHVFDPFFALSEGQGGTGLGLAVCEQVVTDHGGTLSVESTPGAGTTFSLCLPTGQEVAPEVVAPPTSRRAQVLLIDDDAALTRSLRRALSSRCDVTIAANGKEGLERLLAPGDGYDLVLCDLSMPVMNGRQMYEQILKQAPHLAPGIVFITGGALSHDTEQFINALPNTKLFKPFSPRALLDLLDARVSSSPPGAR